MSNSNKFKDRNPGVVAAGRKYPVDKDGVKLSMVSDNVAQDQTVGKRVARSYDPSFDKSSTFGVVTSGNNEAASDLLRPPNRTRFQEQMDNFRPKHRPHGTTNFDKDAMFGKVEVGDGSSVAKCVKGDMGSKPEDEPGLQVNRHYGGTFDNMNAFGVPTPNDPSGSQIKQTLKWENAGTNGTRIVSTKSLQFMKGHERIDPMSTGPLGYKAPSDHLSAEKLMSTDRKHQDRVLAQTEMAKKVRPLMMMSQYFMFNSFANLRSAFEEGDTDSSGALDKEEFENVLRSLGFEFEDAILSGIMRVCDHNGDGQIDYNEFVSLADFGEPLPSDVGLVGKKKETYIDSSATFGMSSIRRDRPPPTQRSVADKANYGDPTSSGTLITPTPLTSMGFAATELDVPRSKSQLSRIFQAMYPTLTEEDVDNAWTHATGGAYSEGVSINEFMDALFAEQ